MTCKEEITDLFSVSEEYYFAHCISADFEMGQGIAVEFDSRFDMKRTLKAKLPTYAADWSAEKDKGDCILEGRTLNLITKKRYFHKPTYRSLKSALEVMKTICIENGISRVAMPTIGCGLDRLQWNKVNKIIKEVFGDTDIEILVCRLK